MKCRILLAASVLFATFLLTARGGEAPKLTLTATEKKILELTNAERKKNELAPLTVDPLLFKAARDHCANMAKQDKMEHELDGKNPFDRIKDAGYKPRRGGENIAMGEGDVSAAEIFQGWMESKGHRENILKAEFTQIGLGHAKGKEGKIYYAQVFGTPQN